MVLFVDGAEPIKVELYRVEVALVHVSKSRARVDESNFLRLCVCHAMVVHTEAAESNFKVLIALEYIDPCDVTAVIPFLID